MESQITPPVLDEIPPDSPKNNSMAITTLIVGIVCLVLLCILPIVVIAILTIMGPVVGDVFSTINSSLK